MCSKRIMTAVLAATIASPALAQDDDPALEEIVVTAAKRAGVSVQDIPTNISAISADRLTRAGITDFEGIARIAGITTVDDGPGNKAFIIRGVQASGGPVVGVYYDEILGTGAAPTGNNGGQPDLRVVDISQVEIVRGPQGTLYGAGAIGGIVKYVFNKPVMNEFSASVLTDFSSVGQGGDTNYTADAIVNLPLVEDRLALRVTGGVQRDEGIIDRPALGLTGTDDHDIDSYRAILRWNATDDLTFTGTYIDQKRELGDTVVFSESCDPAVNLCVGGGFTGDDDSRTNPSGFLNPFVDDMQLYSFVAEYGTDYGTFTASYSNFDRILDPIDDTTDFTQPAQAALRNTITNDQTNAEIRFASTFDSPVNFVAGVSYLQRDTVFTGFVGAPPADTQPVGPVVPTIFDQTVTRDFESKAFFGEVTYDFSDRWALTVGTRVFQLDNVLQEDRRTELFGFGLPIGLQPAVESEFNDEIFKASLAFNATDDVLLYASWAEGFREGGANPIRIPALSATYDPDTITNWELGWKTTLLDGQLTFNGALFRLIWDNIQVGLDVGPVNNFVNAGGAEIDGVEVEALYEPAGLEGLSLNFGMNWLDPRYTDDIPGIDVVLPDFSQSTLVPSTATSGRAGDLIQQATRFTASGSAQYDFELFGRGAFTALDWSYTGEAFTEFRRDDPADIEIGDYHLFNARVGVSGDIWTATLYVNNLFDERGLTDAGTRLGTVPPGLLRLPNTVIVTYPRTVGVSLSLDF